MTDQRDSDDARIPLAEALGGLDVHPLEPGWTALEAFVLVKCIDEIGKTTWAYRTTNILNREELLGALVVHVDLLRKDLLDQWDEG